MNFKASSPRRKWRSWLLAAGVVISLPVLAQATHPGNPAVRQPVAPQVQGADQELPTEGKTVKPWKPGDPVRVMEDLKEDPPKENGRGEAQAQGPQQGPVVREPVAPKVMDKKLQDLPQARPYQPGEPVRVMEDLKETPPTEREEAPDPPAK